MVAVATTLERRHRLTLCVVSCRRHVLATAALELGLNETPLTHMPWASIWMSYQSDIGWQSEHSHCVLFILFFLLTLLTLFFLHCDT